MKFQFFLVSVLAISLLFTSCSLPGKLALEAATSTPSATPTPSPTSTPIPTPTPVPAARVIMGDAALFAGDWEAAVGEYQSAQQNSPDPELQGAALVGIGRAHLLDGNIDQALAALEGVLQNSAHLPAYLVAQADFFLAQALTEAGRFAEAVDAYTGYLSHGSGLIDAYILDLRGDAHMEAGNYAAAAADFQAALAQPSLLDATFLEMKTARAYALGENYPAALTLYDDLYARTGNDFTKALINLRKGQVYTNLAQPDLANQAYLESVNSFPTAYESYSALQVLVDAGVLVEDLNQGLVNYYAGDYGNALTAFNRYLQNNPADPATALFFTSLINRENGDYPAAIQGWETIIQDYPEHAYWDEAWEQVAYTEWAFQEEYTFAVETLLQFSQDNPDHARAGEFLFDAAQIAERDGQLEQAAELWQRVANLYPGDENAQRAVFLAGISLYRLGDFDQAQQVFQRILELGPAISDRAMALFWIGKSLRAQGMEEEARQYWQQAAEMDPTGYYSERAREILRNRQPFSPPIAFDLAYDHATERIKADEWVRQTFGILPGADLSGPGELASDPGLLRGTELWNLGLQEDARAEFEKLRLEVESDGVLSYRLANYMLELGLYRSAIMAARNVLDLAGLSDADTLNAPAYFNHIRFGTYFPDLVVPAAEDYGIHPLFLYSLIRQESLFESFVRSSAAASGLMQIIPSTGEQIANELAWPPNFETEDLYRPVVSVKLGTDYLKSQFDLFEGDAYAALAAYNGGPGNAAQWEKLAADDPDLFLEVVRYAETRNYIRGIYEIYQIYRRIYDRTP